MTELQSKFRMICNILGRITIDLGRPYEDIGINDYESYKDWQVSLKEEQALYEEMRLDVLEEMEVLRGL